MLMSATGGRNKQWLITYLVSWLTVLNEEENQNFINNSSIRPGLPDYSTASSFFHGEEPKMMDKEQMRNLFID